jgi:hypothetical protein
MVLDKERRRLYYTASLILVLLQLHSYCLAEVALSLMVFISYVVIDVHVELHVRYGRGIVTPQLLCVSVTFTSQGVYVVDVHVLYPLD